jgi:hypothetical protein
MPYDPPTGWPTNPLEDLNIIDYGDLAFDYAKTQDFPQTLTDHIRTILAAGAGSITLGGDHSITFPILRAYAERFGPLSLIHFDAHSDLWPDDDYDRIDHGTMFYKAVKSGLVDPKRSVQIGIRTTTEDYLGVNVITAREVHVEQEVHGELRALRRAHLERASFVREPALDAERARREPRHRAVRPVRTLGRRLRHGTRHLRQRERLRKRNAHGAQQAAHRKLPRGDGKERGEAAHVLLAACLGDGLADGRARVERQEFGRRSPAACGAGTGGDQEHGGGNDRHAANHTAAAATMARCAA